MSKTSYLVFAYYQYYPNGGANDLQLVTDNLEEACEKVIQFTESNEYGHSEYDGAHVLEVSDGKTEKIYARGWDKQ